VRPGYDYSKRERTADLSIHVLGMGFGLGAAVTLFCLGRPEVERHFVIPLGLYAFGLIAMLTCSALYNLTDQPDRKALFRRFDHMAIFLMIAGTYSPYCMIGLHSDMGDRLLAFVWATAAAGAALKLLAPNRFERVSVVLYLLLGWCGFLVFKDTPDAFPPFTTLMLMVGAALYSFGVIFHLSHKLPYHNALWHAFVLAAAIAHFLSIARLVQLAA
jgi:hemolysin III